MKSPKPCAACTKVRETWLTLRTLRSTAGGLVADPLLAAGSGVVSFGEDVTGELYVLRGNDILRLESDTPAVPALPWPATLLLCVLLASVGTGYHTARAAPRARARGR